jgi:hypothetical protein
MLRELWYAKLTMLRELYIENGVRYAKMTENFNCLMIINTDRRPDDPESTRVVLSTTMKVEWIHEIPWIGKTLYRGLVSRLSDLQILQ